MAICLDLCYNVSASLDFEVRADRLHLGSSALPNTDLPVCGRSGSGRRETDEGLSVRRTAAIRDTTLNGRIKPATRRKLDTNDTYVAL